MRTLRILTVAASVILLSATLASAQATRTWVSGVGDDANPCSRTAPCKTFAGAISKTATHGEINAIDPGGFGAVTITKAITINGDYTLAGILSAGTTGVIVNITAPASAGPVTLRNLNINGANTGIDGVRMIAGTALHIENCKIFNVTGQGIEVSPVVPAQVTPRLLYVKDTTISDAVGGGIVITGPVVSAFLDNVRVEGTGANGVRVEQGNEAIIRNSFFTGNTQNGVNAVSGAMASPALVTVDGSMVSGNSSAGLRSSGNAATIRVGNSVVAGNAQGLIATGGGFVISFGDNRVAGNDVDGAPTSTIPRM